MPNEVRRGGKKNRKHGRSKRKPGGGLAQQRRTAANKAKRLEHQRLLKITDSPYKRRRRVAMALAQARKAQRLAAEAAELAQQPPA